MNKSPFSIIRTKILNLLMQDKSNKIIIWATVLSVLYAIIRYHIFKDVPLIFILKVSNKGISLASILLIAISLSIGPLSRKFPSIFSSIEQGKRLFGLWGFTLAFFHSLLSLLLLKPSQYASFFSFLTLNGLGEYVLVTGFISLFLLAAAFTTSFPHLYSISRRTFQITQFAGYIGCVVAGLHVVPIGINNWHKLSTWPGYLFPITLLSFLLVLITVILRTSSTFLPQVKKRNS